MLEDRDNQPLIYFRNTTTELSDINSETRQFDVIRRRRISTAG